MCLQLVVCDGYCSGTEKKGRHVTNSYPFSRCTCKTCATIVSWRALFFPSSNNAVKQREMYGRWMSNAQATHGKCTCNARQRMNNGNREREWRSERALERRNDEASLLWIEKEESVRRTIETLSTEPFLNSQNFFPTLKLLKIFTFHFTSLFYCERTSTWRNVTCNTLKILSKYLACFHIS